MTICLQKWPSKLKHYNNLIRSGSRRCFSNLTASDVFGPPPTSPQRRVVVTGLGMVSPLANGVKASWEALIEGKCGVRALSVEDLKMEGFDNETLIHTLEQLPSRVVAAVPRGKNVGEFDEEYWLHPKPYPYIHAT